MIKDSFRLSLRSLRHRGVRSWLTILGIFIGIAAVVSLISLGAGLKTAITGQFGALSIDRLTLQNKGTGFGPPGSTVVEKLNDQDVKVLERIRGIDLIVPRIIRIVNVEFNGVGRFQYVADVPDDKRQADFVYDSFSLETSSGRLLRNGETGKVLIGPDIVNNFDGKPLRPGSIITIQKEKFEVAGILKKTNSFQTNSVILMSRSDLEKILGKKGEYDVIVMQIKDKDMVEEVALNVERELRKDRKEKIGEETFQVQTPSQSISSVNTILNIVNLIIIGIAAISLLVGAIGIANTMYTSVLERTKEIGIMKAIGARNSDVLLIFLIESGLLGLIGGIVGAIIGLSLAFIIAFLANNLFGTNLIEVSISYWLILFSILFAFVIGVISGIWPARKAAKLNVVDALRK